MAQAARLKKLKALSKKNKLALMILYRGQMSTLMFGASYMNKAAIAEAKGFPEMTQGVERVLQKSANSPRLDMGSSQTGWLTIDSPYAEVFNQFEDSIVNNIATQYERLGIKVSKKTILREVRSFSPEKLADRMRKGIDGRWKQFLSSPEGRQVLQGQMRAELDGAMIRRNLDPSSAEYKKLVNSLGDREFMKRWGNQGGFEAKGKTMMETLLKREGITTEAKGVRVEPNIVRKTIRRMSRKVRNLIKGKIKKSPKGAETSRLFDTIEENEGFGRLSDRQLETEMTTIKLDEVKTRPGLRNRKISSRRANLEVNDEKWGKYKWEDPEDLKQKPARLLEEKYSLKGPKESKVKLDTTRATRASKNVDDLYLEDDFDPSGWKTFADYTTEEIVNSSPKASRVFSAAEYGSAAGSIGGGLGAAGLLLSVTGEITHQEGLKVAGKYINYVALGALVLETGLTGGAGAPLLIMAAAMIAAPYVMRALKGNAAESHKQMVEAGRRAASSAFARGKKRAAEADAESNRTKIQRVISQARVQEIRRADQNRESIIRGAAKNSIL